MGMIELNQKEVNEQMYLFVKQWIDNMTFEESKKVPVMAIAYCLARLSKQDELLQEQEAITPYIDIDEAKCPVCKVKLTRQELIGDDVIFEDFFDYCPKCGKPILWEGR